MQGFFLMIVIVCIVTFVGYKIDCWNDERKEEIQKNMKINKSFQRNSDEKKQIRDKSIMKAVSQIETMCNYLKTGFFPVFLKGKSVGWVYFGKALDDSGVLDAPDYTIAIPFSLKFDGNDLFEYMKFKQEYPQSIYCSYREGILRSREVFPAILATGGFGEYIEWGELLFEVEKELRKKANYSIEVYAEYMRIIPK